jgi:hypothetical protein
MKLKRLMDAHRVQQHHLRQFFAEYDFDISASHFSRIIKGKRTMLPKVRGMIRAAMIQFGASQAEIDSCPELKP